MYADGYFGSGFYRIHFTIYLSINIIFTRLQFPHKIISCFLHHCEHAFTWLLRCSFRWWKCWRHVIWKQVIPYYSNCTSWRQASNGHALDRSTAHFGRVRYNCNTHTMSECSHFSLGRRLSLAEDEMVKALIWRKMSKQRNHQHVSSWSPYLA